MNFSACFSAKVAARSCFCDCAFHDVNDGVGERLHRPSKVTVAFLAAGENHSFGRDFFGRDCPAGSSCVLKSTNIQVITYTTCWYNMVL